VLALATYEFFLKWLTTFPAKLSIFRVNCLAVGALHEDISSCAGLVTTVYD